MEEELWVQKKDLPDRLGAFLERLRAILGPHLLTPHTPDFESRYSRTTPPALRKNGLHCLSSAASDDDAPVCIGTFGLVVVHNNDPDSAPRE